MLFGDERADAGSVPEPALAAETIESREEDSEPSLAGAPPMESEASSDAPPSETPVATPELEPETAAASTGFSAPAFDDAAPIESSSEPPSTDGEAGGRGGTLVIIEDDQGVAQYYATLFKGNGYRVEVASDGVSGVDLCARMRPDVILLDVMMPRQNGILVLQTLRASDETKGTPVVVLSNFSEPTLIKRALQLGALEYVIKTQVEGPALLEALPRWMKNEKAFAAA